MNKKYQVFISSTYEDLKEERDQAIKAVLEMGHIPVGMEMFSAGDEEQWQIIARQIEATDYYVVIVGHRYGSETDEGISYTEKEYDYAKECGVPTLGFVIDNKAPWPHDKTDNDSVKKGKLDVFKAKVKSKPIHFWSNKEDLHGKVSISLIKTMNANPRVGWTRSDEAIGPEVTKEISRLSAENAHLRRDIEKLKKAKNSQENKVKEVARIMFGNKRSLRVRESTATPWEDSHEYINTLFSIFRYIAPNLINESSNSSIAIDIAFNLHGNKYSQETPIPTNMISGLITDFVALEVIEPSKKKHTVSDKEKYWTLTILGKELIKKSKRIELESNLNSGEDEQETKDDNSKKDLVK
ncbi:DUF4062 domain-containing protein [Psychrobacter sp. DAB_AL62B]|uniref:DUF4062 domain-containing protein n=1 Tax=Psychrobacter sp. DAB_AL62B TaxID=1028420 RepID=UPI0023813C09|nr:DUF4062 domain-containing protein [Psychrobacter sp. DAB_AL62B]MDE4455349.1 DUF4062 domain-containing protein [Psychrobacter sp. DAB_AL62B]